MLSLRIDASEYLPLLREDGSQKIWTQSRLFQRGVEKGTYDWSAPRHYTHVQFFRDRFYRSRADSFVCKLEGLRIVHNVNQRYSNGLCVKHVNTPVASLKLGKVINVIKGVHSE